MLIILYIIFFSFFYGNYSIAFFSFLFFLINLFIYYFWLFWVFVSVRGLSPVLASDGHSSSCCALRGPLTVEASAIAEQRLQTRRLSSRGSQA